MPPAMPRLARLGLLFLMSCQQPGAPEADSPRPRNHLVGETSPYLLQHVNNPVDWYPWGEAALSRARELDRPIFLSIGYSACHWCHVMEHESFENELVAAFLNQHFVSIKVDREERPDLDELYMSAVQKMTGSGGWPMTVFLTPELQPFYGGTYFPPSARHGRPGFLDLIRGIEQAWRERRPEIEQSARELSDALVLELPEAPEEGGLPEGEALAELLREGVRAFHAEFDPEWGGFGAAPKFPRTDDLRWMLAALPWLPEAEAETVRAMVDRTLTAMAAGGMYDQIGGGFARYSVDEKWWVPHFEKMLYDQGTLIPTYLDGWCQLGQPRFEEVARASCDYLLRERRDPGGAFWSATDADSEGVEGKFFAWTPAQLVEVLGEEKGAWAAARYGVPEAGTFEHGTSVLRELEAPAGTPPEWEEEVRAALYAARAQRIAPGNDDKILTAWNGLAIDALATAGRVLGEPRYTEAARDAAGFLLDALRGEDGRWRRSWRAGKAQHDAVLEDYAYLCRGLLALFQATGDERWLTEAAALGQIMLDDFWDERSGVFFNTDGRDATVLHRMQSPWDGATPSPNAVAIESLLMLHAFTLEEAWRAPAQRGLHALLGSLRRMPRAFAATLRLLPLAAGEPRVAVVIGAGSADSMTAWRTFLHSAQAPPALLVFRESAAPECELGLFAHRPARDGQATLYFCEGAHCRAPLTDPAAF
ncbi:MAG: thioredoxin domain-containing protein [Planctomycetes bacterium]|nr:thioredoxin domain-containing protein [Planctomycetota bacterium]